MTGVRLEFCECSDQLPLSRLVNFDLSHFAREEMIALANP